MPIEIKQGAGFIPQTSIKITDTRKDTLLSNIKIERKIGTEDFTTIMTTDADGSVFTMSDINDFGKVYEYRVTYDVYQKQKYSSSNRKNYWSENWDLKNLKISSDGTLSGTGTATAKTTYLSMLNKEKEKVIDMTAWIGVGGDSRGFNGGHEVVKKGKKKSYKPLDKNTFDNIIIYIDYGNYYIPRSLFITKAWANSKKWDAKFWYYLNKRDVNNKRNQIKLVKSKEDGFNLQVFFNRSSKTYSYGFYEKMKGLKTSNSLSTKGGKCTRLRIALKNGAKIKPNFNTNSHPIYRYVKIDSYQENKRIIIKDEPEVDYGIIINEYGEGFRFKQFEPNGLQDSESYETKSTSQILEIQDSEFPVVYVNDNKKTPETGFTILVDNFAYRNRMRNQILKKNYIYIYTPKKWNYQLINGFYTYESVSEERVGYSENLYKFNFSGARRVLNNITIPPKWTYERLKELERNYVSIIDDYRDYGDLAISPTGNEILGEEESEENEVL